MLAEPGVYPKSGKEMPDVDPKVIQTICAGTAAHMAEPDVDPLWIQVDLRPSRTFRTRIAPVLNPPVLSLFNFKAFEHSTGPSSAVFRLTSPSPAEERNRPENRAGSWYLQRQC